MGFLDGDRAMLDAFRHDKNFAGPERYVLGPCGGSVNGINGRRALKRVIVPCGVEYDSSILPVKLMPLVSCELDPA